MRGHFFLSDVRGKGNSGPQALGVCSRKRERRAVYVRSLSDDYSFKISSHI